MSPPRSRRFLAPLGVALLVLAWGSTFAAIEVGLEAAPPLTFAGLRSVIGGAVMAVLALLWREKLDLRRDWAVLAKLTVSNVVAFFALQTIAVDLLASGLAAVLIYLQPVLVGLLAWRFLGEALTPAKVGGLLLGFIGIIVVSAGAFGDDIAPVGILVAVASSLAWAVGTVYFKAVQNQVPMFWAVAVPFVVGGLLLTGLGLVVEAPTSITWTASFVTALLYASLVGTALAWFLWLELIRSGEASRASAYVFLVPLVAVLIGTVFLGETLTLPLLLGGALVIGGIVLVNRRPRLPS